MSCTLPLSHDYPPLSHDSTLPYHMTLPSSSHRLLCSVVDNVEALIDEWFPGLRDIDMQNGSELLSPSCLCPLCSSECVMSAFVCPGECVGLNTCIPPDPLLLPSPLSSPSPLSLLSLSSFPLSSSSPSLPSPPSLLSPPPPPPPYIIIYSGSGESHSFTLKELQLVSLKADEIMCPYHNGMVHLEQLVC